MAESPESTSSAGLASPAARVFATTNWSVVMAAGDITAPESASALQQLCQSYWYPLYAYVRRRGFSPEDAEDLTQEFFHHLLASDWLVRADPNKGRFRTFLLCGIQNFLGNEWQRMRRLKRGGGHQTIPLDALEAEERYRIEPKDVSTADKLFERRWALTLLEGVLARLEAEMAGTDAGERFDALRPVLLGDPGEKRYAALAQDFSVSESTIKSWVHRLRQRYRELLREAVEQTVSKREEIDDELRHLARILAA